MRSEETLQLLINFLTGIRFPVLEFTTNDVYVLRGRAYFVSRAFTSAKDLWAYGLSAVFELLKVIFADILTF